jgi:hypothetical protein
MPAPVQQQRGLFQLQLPDVIAEPASLYADLLNVDPVLFDSVIQAWMVSRHTDVQAVLANPGSSVHMDHTGAQSHLPGSGLGDAVQMLDLHVSFTDGTDHAWLRRVLAEPLQFADWSWDIARCEILMILTAGAVVTVADRLIAFVVADADHVARLPGADLADVLRGHAAALLPPFAVHNVLRVEALPLTAGGKTDRAALRARATAANPASTDNAPQAGGSLPIVLEVVAATICRAARRDTDVLDAGGHSQLVARVRVALSDALGVEVPYVAVATGRTPAGIAAAIGPARAAGSTV